MLVGQTATIIIIAAVIAAAMDKAAAITRRLPYSTAEGSRSNFRFLRNAPTRI